MGSSFKSIVVFIISLFFLIVVFSCKSVKKTQSSANHTSYRESPEESKCKSFYVEACRHKALGNPELALEQFKKALELSPKNAAIFYEIGNVYKHIHKYDAAIKYSKSAINIDNSNPWYHLLYIDCLSEAHQYNEAAEACASMVKLFPNNQDFHSRLAEEYENAGKYESALKVYELIEKKFPPVDQDILLNRLKVLRTLKKSAEEELLLIRLIKENPSETNYYIHLADLYKENNRAEKAMEIYKKISEKDPDNPFVHLSLADYYRSQRNDSMFFKELKSAFYSPVLELNEKSKILISFYTISDQYPEYRQKGIELCEILNEVHPDNPKSHTIYADYLSREGRLEEARLQYLSALNYESGFFAIWQEVLKIDVELQDYNSLEKHSREASELFPLQPLPVFYLGAAKIQLKKYQEGIEFLNEAKELAILDTQLLVQININLVDAYNYLKKFRESDIAFQRANELDAENVYLLNNYSYYLSLRKEKLDLAEELSAKANKLQPDNPQFLDTYAWILYQLGKYKEAKVWMEKALKAEGDKNGVILEHYGDILFQLNQIETAVDYWNKSKSTGRHSEFIDKKISERKIYE
jgi:tetratricopeptide (TPR) repeat protein